MRYQDLAISSTNLTTLGATTSSPPSHPGSYYSPSPIYFSTEPANLPDVNAK